MKKYFFLFTFFLLLSQFVSLAFAAEPFRFVLFTDLHISPTNHQPTEDLQNAVNDVNAMKNIDFVIVAGDVTESGDNESLLIVKKVLQKLHITYCIIPGNHETKWSESGATDFQRIFGDDKFSFAHKGCQFIGFNTGPIIKMGDGHIAPQDINWMKNVLKKTGKSIPIFVITHYPLQTGDVDNWFSMTDVLRKYNIQAIFGGHYHRNALLSYDGLPGIVFRSTLRDKESVGGYSILSVSDSIQVFEKKIGQHEQKWLTLPLETKKYEKSNVNLQPSFEINKPNRNVSEVWKLNTNVAIYCSPTVSGNYIYYGDDLGYMHCISLKNGNEEWKFKTGSRIISSSAVSNDKVIFASTDGSIYCLNTNNGKIIWVYETKMAILGLPLIKSDTLFIGASDGFFRALDINSGSLIWRFTGLKGYVETRPVVALNKIYFGAWDANFYALNIKDGSLAWKWNNGQAGIHYSPAAVLPVYSKGKIFITAPDRYWTALDAESGKEIWRTNEHQVRESIGISEDGNVVFSRCMNDSVVALDANTDYPSIIWKINAGYGYDHNPSMMIERDGVIVFGTKNGLLHGINAKTGSVLWRYKIGNSIINTVTMISKNECILTTTEGVVARIKY